MLTDTEGAGNGWQQHGAAVMLGRSERYLSRITKVAREVVKGNGLFSNAKEAMTKDIDHNLRTGESNLHFNLTRERCRPGHYEIGS